MLFVCCMTSFVKDLKIKLPLSVKWFCIKIALLFTAWQLLYLFVLLPARIPDKQITIATAAGTSKVLNWLYPHDDLRYKPAESAIPMNTMVAVYINRQKVIGIADGCNAFELQVLFIGILLSISRIRPLTILYILVGVPLITVCNILRCSLIGWLNINQHISLSNFAHHYLFKILIYGLIFYMWKLYAENKSDYGNA